MRFRNQILKENSPMHVKLFEIRDRMTNIPALAVRISGRDGYPARRAGYGQYYCVILTKLQTDECSNDPYKWKGTARTMSVAHQHIMDNWDNLNSEDVIDVEFILKETTHAKESEQGI
jgi:hypothetical protein